MASGINIGLSMTISFCEPCRTMKISSETEIGLEDKGVLFIRTLRSRDVYTRVHRSGKDSENAEKCWCYGIFLSFVESGIDEAVTVAGR